jgi:integrase
MGRKRNDGNADLPQGIERYKTANGCRLRIYFYYRGRLHREAPTHNEDTPKNRKDTERLHQAVTHAIEQEEFYPGSFCYAKFFPNSPRCAEYGYAPRESRRTVGAGLRAYDQLAKETLDENTYLSYHSIIGFDASDPPRGRGRGLRTSGGHLIPEFGHLPLTELTPAILRNWIVKLPLTVKRIRNILVPLRNTLDIAVEDKEIAVNPVRTISPKKLLRRPKRLSEYKVQPFNAQERESILAVAGEGHLGNQIETWWWSGLRHEEIIALEVVGH